MILLRYTRDTPYATKTWHSLAGMTTPMMTLYTQEKNVVDAVYKAASSILMTPDEKNIPTSTVDNTPNTTGTAIRFFEKPWLHPRVRANYALKQCL